MSAVIMGSRGPEGATWYRSPGGPGRVCRRRGYGVHLLTILSRRIRAPNRGRFRKRQFRAVLGRCMWKDIFQRVLNEHIHVPTKCPSEVIHGGEGSR